MSSIGKISELVAQAKKVAASFLLLLTLAEFWFESNIEQTKFVVFTTRLKISDTNSHVKLN